MQNPHSTHAFKQHVLQQLMQKRLQHQKTTTILVQKMVRGHVQKIIGITIKKKLYLMSVKGTRGMVSRAHELFLECI
jgi:hypothetical protein